MLHTCVFTSNVFYYLPKFSASYLFQRGFSETGWRHMYFTFVSVTLTKKNVCFSYFLFFCLKPNTLSPSLCAPWTHSPLPSVWFRSGTLDLSEQLVSFRQIIREPADLEVMLEPLMLCGGTIWTKRPATRSALSFCSSANCSSFKFTITGFDSV